MQHVSTFTVSPQLNPFGSESLAVARQQNYRLWWANASSSWVISGLINGNFYSSSIPDERIIIFPILLEQMDNTDSKTRVQTHLYFYSSKFYSVTWMSAVHWIPQSLTKITITTGIEQQVKCSLLAGAICWLPFITLFPTRIIYLDGNAIILFQLPICSRNLWNLDVYNVIIDKRGRCICNGPHFVRLILVCEADERY